MALILDEINFLCENILIYKYGLSIFIIRIY